METCRVLSHWPPIKRRFEQTSSFRAATSCCFPPNAKKLGDHSMDDRMFILGMGFVGQFFAADLKNKGCLGVYGDCGGAWVDEDYQVNPASELARARLTAEEEWLRLGRNLGIAAQVFRLGGIYGPGRSAVDTILKQLPLSSGQKMRHSKRFTSRVHVADICQALHASILKPAAGKIYNIVDDDPAPREEVFELAHKLVDEKFPGRINLHISLEREKSLVMDNKISGKGEKRVSNARMKNELGMKLIHPTYTSGLQSIIKQID
ncbi:NAD(P)-binding Rossmann-fold superfamily protein [Striga hermonthica]|uniref:NAD(P)-binding Rossmann-fold superfamily protein n=1 Tax=Striga hermonthica TaxID=68872 RepID=A0A9N7RMW2_STRHE|nr:NAD(P)-binding Rossmann-fold superfamily protein [Striga hermonthica]